MNPLQRTPRTTLHRSPARGSYDRALAHAILDEGLVAAVGFVVEGQPFVLPMAYARRGDELFLHGAAASRLLKHGAGGVPLCVTVTLLDGLVLARSAFHHSMNYRSVVILGTAREVTDPSEKRGAFDALVEHALPGRSARARPASDKELAATRVLALLIEEASIKMRTGGPLDDEEDFAVPAWAGHLPLAIRAAAPIADPRAPVLAPPPENLLAYLRPHPPELHRSGKP